jgi:hypothetical protein
VKSTSREGTSSEPLAEHQDRRRPMADQYPVDAKRYRHGKHRAKSSTNKLSVTGTQSLPKATPAVSRARNTGPASTGHSIRMPGTASWLPNFFACVRPADDMLGNAQADPPTLKGAVARVSTRTSMPEEQDQAAPAQPHKLRLLVRRFCPDRHPRLGKGRGR